MRLDSIISARLFDFFSLSFPALRGPVVHLWDVLLRRLFVGTDASKTGIKICKIMVDQTCFTPLFCIIYYHVKGLAAGLDMAKIRAEVRSQIVVPIDVTALLLCLPLT